MLRALVCFAVIFLIISLGLFKFSISLHTLMFFALIWAASHARLLGYTFIEIRTMMTSGISRALPALFIFILIGMVIAAYMQCGTIAMLIYHGLNLLSPGWFLAAGFILTSLMSVATGTSWGTVGTLGIVLAGIGDTLGIPLPLVVGMIISGATFGDKLSPISDTTNLAAMSAETDLFSHIHSMLYTTGPTFLLALIIFTTIGQFAGHGDLPQAAISEMQMALADTYQLNPFITLLPLLVMLALSLCRFTPEISMSSSVITALLIAIVYQESDAVSAMNSLWDNTGPETGISSLDSLLSRGGMVSMSWTLFLSIMALALGGILHEAGFLRTLVEGLITRLKGAVSLIAATISCGLIGNMGMGEAYITIILNSQLFRTAYDKLKLDRAVLSRTVEEGATMTTGLIPWTTAGAFYAATLGVAVVDYAPYALFNYLNPIVSITMAALGFGLLRQSKGAPRD